MVIFFFGRCCFLSLQICIGVGEAKIFPYHIFYKLSIIVQLLFGAAGSKSPSKFLSNIVVLAVPEAGKETENVLTFIISPAYFTRKDIFHIFKHAQSHLWELSLFSILFPFFLYFVESFLGLLMVDLRV